MSEKPKRVVDTWKKYGLEKYVLTTVRIDDVDWGEWWELWRKSKYKPLNCYPPAINLYRPYFELVDRDLRALLARDSHGTLVGAVPVRIDPKYRNPIFWKHTDYRSGASVIENMEFPEYGVLTRVGYDWLLGVDFCFEEWSYDFGAFDAENTFERAANERLYITFNERLNSNHIVKCGSWRENVSTKFRKEIEKGFEKWEWHGRLLTREEDTQEALSWAMREYKRKWESRDLYVNYRPSDLDNLQRIFTTACREGYAVVSDFTVDGCRSVEAGFLIPDRNAYVVPFVASETGKTKAPLGAMHMAWTMDEMFKLGALTYDQGYASTPFKLKWNPRIVPIVSIIGCGKSPELRSLGKPFTWQPKRAWRKKKYKIKSYDLTAELSTGYPRTPIGERGSGEVGRC